MTDSVRIQAEPLHIKVEISRAQLRVVPPPWHRKAWRFSKRALVPLAREVARETVRTGLDWLRDLTLRAKARPGRTSSLSLRSRVVG